MKAIAITEPGEATVLRMKTFPDPEPVKGEVRISVRAAGLNRADLLQRRGFYPPPPGVNPAIPGLEVAGVVESSQDPLERFNRGDRVMALVSGEGYAERAVVPAAHCMPLPEPLSFVQGAAIPEVFLTAYDALFRQLQVSVGEFLLIHAVGSGVGTAALQLARAAGARVIGTSRVSGKIQKSMDLGLDYGLTTSTPGWPSEVRELTSGRGIDAILDLVGAAYWEENLDLLAPLGRLIVVGLVSGSRVNVDLAIILRKRLRILGTALRSRSDGEKAELISEFRKRCAPLLESGKIHPVVDRVFPWEEVVQAHDYMERNRNFGKIVLSLE
jgi:putative PIG3 family NAD(P)H quinone oxidoreductase